MMLGFVMIFTALLIADPAPCKNGVATGILLCGRVIIPSLFPFTMCVLFIINSGILSKLDAISKVTNKLFGLSGEIFSYFLLSLIGGYPIGAKLLSRAVTLKKISPERAGVVLNYCINAGPAFVISAIGSTILGSTKIGAIIFVGNIISSILLCFLMRNLKTKSPEAPATVAFPINPADNFVLSATEASSAVFGICSLVILFSGIDSYVLKFAESVKLLKPVSLILEVTNAVTFTNNVYLIAFLLGLGGICIWCQIISLSGNIKINYPLFVISRIFHGALSAAVSAAIIKIFKVTLPAISNGKSFSRDIFYSTPALAFSMISMGIIFAISLSAKKTNCKILDDVV